MADPVPATVTTVSFHIVPMSLSVFGAHADSTATDARTTMTSRSARIRALPRETLRCRVAGSTCNLSAPSAFENAPRTERRSVGAGQHDHVDRGGRRGHRGRRGLLRTVPVVRSIRGLDDGRELTSDGFRQVFLQVLDDGRGGDPGLLLGHLDALAKPADQFVHQRFPRVPRRWLFRRYGPPATV